jgi:hypothetical protein
LVSVAGACPSSRLNTVTIGPGEVWAALRDVSNNNDRTAVER